MRYIKAEASLPPPPLKHQCAARGTGLSIVRIAHAKTTPPYAKTYCMGK